MNRKPKRIAPALVSALREFAPLRAHSFWVYPPGAWLPVVALLVSALLANGCTSKSKAESDARTAFLAGQQQAMMRMQQSQNPVVTVHGKVRNTAIPWTEDLTVAKAIVAAEYYGVTDPREIIVVRQGFARRVDPAKLLSGEDLPLKPGDLMEIR